MLMKMGRKFIVRYTFHIYCGASSPKDVMSVSPKADTVFYTYCISGICLTFISLQYCKNQNLREIKHL